MAFIGLGCLLQRSIEPTVVSPLFNGHLRRYLEAMRTSTHRLYSLLVRMVCLLKVRRHKRELLPAS